MLRGEATNTNFIVFCLTPLGLESMIYRTRGEHTNHYATDAVLNCWSRGDNLPYELSAVMRSCHDCEGGEITWLTSWFQWWGLAMTVLWLCCTRFLMVHDYDHTPHKYYSLHIYQKIGVSLEMYHQTKINRK